MLRLFMSWIHLMIDDMAIVEMYLISVVTLMLRYVHA